MSQENNKEITNSELLESMNRGFSNIEKKIEKEIDGVKTDLGQVKTDLEQVKTDLRAFKQETRESFSEINEKLDLVIEDVAKHSDRIEILEEKVRV